MPINACSIDAFTIDGLNCLSVMPVRLKAKKGHPYHTSINYAAYVARMKAEADAAAETYATEGPTINVSVELNGDNYAASADNVSEPIMPMIFVSGIDFTKDLPVEAEVSNLTIIRAGKSTSVGEAINTITITGDGKKNV
jgi:hypothetical protein